MQSKKLSPKRKAVLGQLTDMDLRLLRVFKSVVDCGGITAAELELNIDTSTVSRHVRDLEVRLGLVLCRRGRSGFEVTTEGQRVYDETLRLLAAVEGFRGGIDDIHARLGGTLHIALFDKTASNPRARIGDAIARFTELAPEVELQLHVASINAIECGIIDGSFGVGVIPTHRQSRSLKYTELFGETMLLYCGARHPLFVADRAPLDWEAARAYKFAGLGYHSPNMQLSHSARLPRKATGFDQEAIATLILSGRFLGFLPDHYAEAFERRGLMRAVRPELFHYQCSFVSVVRRAPRCSRVAQVFCECLVEAQANTSDAMAPS